MAATIPLADRTTTRVANRVNVGQRLSEMAQRMPQAVAVVEAVRSKWRRRGKRQYRTVSFEWLESDSSAITCGLRGLGIQPGMRIALLVRPGIDFVSLVFALLKSGAVQVLIDPGMGLRNTIRSLAEIEPDGLIGVPAAQALRAFSRRRLAKASFNITLGTRSLFGEQTLAEIRQRGYPIANSMENSSAIAETSAQSPAAIIFTSGSTGPAKGVLFRHGNFDRQVTEIRDFYGIEPGGIDVSCFPLFGLFNAAMGVTTVFPAMNFSRPAQVDPTEIVAATNDWQATQAFASPAVWNRVGRYCERHSIALSGLRRVFSAGAPVSAAILSRMKACIDTIGEMFTPYGATEALPVASIAASNVLSETARLTEQGLGVCVGCRVPGIEWRVIEIQDGPICTIDDAHELSRGEIGELIVRGPVVTSEYVGQQEANLMAKIRDCGVSENHADGKLNFWHRMGDVGYLDDRDRFWFCGRKSQRVTTATGPMFTIPCEAIYNRHPDVFRSALVGIGPPGGQLPAIVVEPLQGRWPRRRRQREKLLGELRQLGRSEENTAKIQHLLLHKSLPVDVRHNVKINRERLALWAGEKLRIRIP